MADVAVVGAGILGLAHAYHAARGGHRVTVFERGVRAQGASVRNFGMVWPIGQPPGEMRNLALASRRHWVEVLRASGLWHRECGSLTLAYSDDEMAVLEEFAERGQDFGYEARLVSPTGCRDLSPVVRPEHLRGGLHSPSEVCVFPPQVVAELPAYLESLGVEFRWAHAVTHVEEGLLVARGEERPFDHVFICSGDDFETLFPEAHAASGMTRSKLQMLRMRPRRAGYSIGLHLCAGLTLGHYANFRICDRLGPVLERFQREYPEHQRWGIHLLVSQHESGDLTVGDSHEYGLNVDPFLREEIDRLILGYLDTFLEASELETVERWYGVYAKHPTKGFVTHDPHPGVRVVTGVGGAGMTLSFGLAERMVAEQLGPS